MSNPKMVMVGRVVLKVAPNGDYRSEERNFIVYLTARGNWRAVAWLGSSDEDATESAYGTDPKRVADALTEKLRALKSALEEVL